MNYNTMKVKLNGVVSRGIKAAEIDENGHLIFTLTDNTTVDLGDVTGKTAYEAAVEGGFVGTEEQFNEALGKSFDAEAYGAGTRGGEDVEAGDPAYHNNAKYYAEAADASAEAAGSAKTGAETAQSASEAARDAATTAKNTALFAATTAANAAAAAAAAQSAAESAKTAAVTANSSAQAAKTTAEAAATNAESAKTAAESAKSAAQSAKTAAEAAEDAAAASAAEIEDMTVSAHLVQAGGTPTVTKTGGSGGTPYNLDFGIPKGDKGAPGEDGADGEDGYSPAVTISEITGGHRVTINDKTHQSGQSFDVLDGEDGASTADAVSYDNTASGLDADNAQDAIDELAADLEDYAKFDGYYGESGGVFQYSTNFLGKNAPSDEKNIAFRPTASQMSGQAWSAHSIDGQTATIEKIKGKTLVFNQLVQNGNFANGTTGWASPVNATMSVHANICTFLASASGGFMIQLINALANHIYYWKMTVQTTSATNLVEVRIRGRLSGATVQFTEKQTISGLYTSELTEQIAYTLRDYRESGWDNIYVENVLFIDLTQMYGAGNEPATVEEFKAMFPLEYYEYNEGELISLNATGLKTVGFNQLYSDGHIDVLKGLTYKIEGAYTSLKDSAGNDVTVTGGEFVPSTNDTYTMEGGSCVHLKWSGVRDGETEEHWNSTLSLPIATYFTDGMKSAGLVYDELTKDKAVKRIGVVDLGSLTWTNSSTSSGNHFRCMSSGIASLIKPPESSSTAANIKCVKYQAKNADQVYLETVGMAIGIGGSIIVYDTNYNTDTSASAFKAAMSGVYLYYELATPVETPISPPLNLTYRCDDFGTEMLLPQNGDEPVTAPLDADIVYQIDYEGNVRNMPVNTISKESMDAFIAAFNASGLGTITQTWDAANGRYAYTVAPPTPPTE